MSALPDPDRAALAEAGLAQAYLEDLRTALQQGPRGAVTDMALMASPWGLRPGLIRAPVRLMHRLDRRPPAEAEADYYARTRDGRPVVHT